MKNKSAVELGKLGGQATLNKLGKEHFRKITKGWPKGKKRKFKDLEWNNIEEKIKRDLAELT